MKVQSFFRSTISKVKFDREIAIELDKDLADVSLEMESEVKERTPVITGRLKSSMVGRKRKFLEHEVATNVEYAPYVEYGTSRFAGRAMLRRGAAAVEKRGASLLRRSGKFLK